MSSKTQRPALKPRTDRLPKGTSRRFVMQPHGYYDTAAEVVEQKGTGSVALWRSKTRCSTTSEWMEVGDAGTGQALWRIEGRYGDRCVPHQDTEDSSSQWYITVLRLYRGYEKKPQLLLVYRSPTCDGITASRAHKDVEVYLCNDAGEAADDAELAMDPSRPKLKPVTDDEAFVFARLPQGEDAFTISCNATFSKICLTSTLPDDEGSPHEGRRVLATLDRTTEMEERKMNVDHALDVSLVTALFSAVDQLMVSTNAIDYDVEWPQDYAYILNGACLANRKSVRRMETFTGGMAPNESKIVSSRMCPFF